ncbi:MAG: hypothetical protein LBG93_03055 [Treponema sp.]|nr:hypothetical protein [Treponema sp.]
MKNEQLKAIKAWITSSYSNDHYVGYGLKRDIRDLIAEVERLTRERDAAVADLKNINIQETFCSTCKYFNFSAKENPCAQCLKNIENGRIKWQWRGVQEEV